MSRHVPLVRFCIGILVLLSLAACSLAGKFIAHPNPALQTDDTAFETANCPTDKYGFRYCEPDSPLAALGCDRILTDDLLSGLNPRYSIAYCYVEPGHHPPDMQQLLKFKADHQFFYDRGCMIPVFVRYVINRDGKFEIIETPEEFRQIFAPIESENEALSYAIAMTGLQSYFGLKPDPQLHYFIDTIEDTHVTRTDDGYQVHLFQKAVCGCGPHPTSSVEVMVTSGGEIKLLSSQQIWKDSREDNLCVD